MTDLADDARALLLFEQLTDWPERRAALLTDTPPGVLAALAALEEAAPRARAAFPTEEDAAPRRRLLALPTRAGAYSLGATLGEGGMGLVFAAERADGLFDHSVAIKLIHPDRFSDAALDRFAHERRLLARLQHHGIARLIDGGVTADGWPYIIMERIDGLSLDRHAVDRAVPQLRRIALIEQVCEAVATAHAALVVHGDIKPGNVLVDAHGRAKLLDFGVARLIDDGEASATAQPRTLAFASPAVRDGAPPTVADDVYALGVLLRAVTNAEAEDGHLRAPPDRDLSAIADRAAADDPVLRYRSVDGLADDLARWRAGQPVRARVPTIGYVTSRFVARHRRGIAMGTVVAAMLAGLATLAVGGWQTAAQRSAVAAQRAGDLRRIARYQLTVLLDRMEHQPRSTALRLNLAREAETALTGIASAQGSPGMRREAAEGYRLLARIEGAPDRPSLGRPERAAAALARAEMLLAGDGSAAGHAALARLAFDGAAIAGAGGDTDRAMSLLARARALAGDSGGPLADDIDLLAADTMIWNGDYAAALAQARRVSERHRGTPLAADEALRHDRIIDRQAEATFYLNDERGAASLYARAVNALEAARLRWPEEAALDWALARQRWNLGTTLVSLGEPTRGLPLLRAAGATMARVAADDPDDMVAARRLRSYDLANAQALAATGRAGEAVDLLTANIAARRRWAAASPGDTARRRDLAIAVAALGDVHAGAGQAAAACARYAEVHRLHAELARAGRLSRLDSGYFAGLVSASERSLHCAAAPD